MAGVARAHSRKQLTSILIINATGAPISLPLANIEIELQLLLVATD